MEGSLGRKVGKYELLRVLGKGGMGTVYEAVHELTKKRVAIKVTHAWVVQKHPTAGPRFIREAQVSATIGHPALVDVIDAGQQEDGSFYLVFELLEGRNLGQAMDDLAPHEIAGVCIDVLDALSAAHRKNFVHRDIKPENVFLQELPDGKTRVRLLDFGIAKQLDETVEAITRTGDIVGTLDFMSPEQAMTQAVDARSDIWAVGAVLHRGLTKSVLFDAPTPLERLRMLANHTVPSIREKRPDLPPAMAEVVDCALQKNPDDRFKDALEMRSALLDAVAASVHWTGDLKPPSGEFRKTITDESTDVIQRMRAKDTEPMRRPQRWIPVLVLLTAGIVAFFAFASENQTSDESGPDVAALAPPEPPPPPPPPEPAVTADAGVEPTATTATAADVPPQPMPELKRPKKKRRRRVRRRSAPQRPMRKAKGIEAPIFDEYE